jgi:hypothetical protein
MAHQRLTFSGTPGGLFTAIPNAPFTTFGVAPGKISLNGEPLQVTDWRASSVVGLLPSNAQHGPVVLTTGDTSPKRHDATEFTGDFGVKNEFGLYTISPAQQLILDAEKRVAAELAKPPVPLTNTKKK